MIDFVIVGTFKSASSTLAYELGSLPEIDIPKPKDPYFYLAEMCRDLTGPEGFMSEHNEHSVYDRSAFEALFTKTGELVLRGEATPLYMYCHQQAIPALKADNTETRIIIVLRNPIDRAFSNYMHNVKDGYEKRTFAECVATWEDIEQLPLHPFFHYVRAGFYDEQVAAYRRAFENVKIINYDDVLTDPNTVLNDICNFLGVTSNYERKNIIRLNKTGSPKSKYLHDFFKHESTLKKNLRPIYRTLFRSKETRARISESVINFNIKSSKLDSSSHAILSEIYRADIDALGEKPGCEFVKNWLAYSKE
jgi:hypothetical protein